MNTEKWKVIEDFVLDDPRFDSDDFEEFCEVINNMDITKLHFRCTYENCEYNKDKTNIPFKDLDREVLGDHLDFMCPKCGRVIICGMGYLNNGELQ